MNKVDLIREYIEGMADCPEECVTLLGKGLLAWIKEHNVSDEDLHQSLRTMMQGIVDTAEAFDKWLEQNDHEHPGPDCKYLGNNMWDCGVIDQAQ